MSRAYRELIERFPYLDAMYGEDTRDRRQAEQGMREWYEDKQAQEEFQLWLDTLDHD